MAEFVVDRAVSELDQNVVDQGRDQVPGLKVVLEHSRSVMKSEQAESAK